MIQSTLDNLRELSQMPWLKTFLAFCASCALEMVGHPDSAAMWLFMLLICDLALGVVRAWKTNTFNGAKITRGAFKFFRYWLAVAMFVMTDGTMKKAFPMLPVSISDTFIAYLSINEAFSCVDHLAFFGMPVPESFLKRLRTYRKACLSGKWACPERRHNDDYGKDGDL